MAKNKYMAFREYQYKSIRPGVLVEEYLEAPHGGNVREIKFYCFHGEPRFIQVVNDRFHGKREAFYDPDWNLMPFWGPVPLIEERLPRPGGLYAMREQARALSRPFLFCRIDFLHDTVDRHWFGEITFHHGAGLVRFEPPEFERRFGDYIDLSRLDETRRLQRALA